MRSGTANVSDSGTGTVQHSQSMARGIRPHDSSGAEKAPVAELQPRGLRFREALASVLVVVICMIVYALIGSLLSDGAGFWSVDSAVRFVQTESLLRNSLRDFSVPYPAASLDPHGQFFPFGPWFHFSRHGKFYLSYQPYFSALSAPLYALIGPTGLLVLPILGGLATVLITYHVTRRIEPSLAPMWSLALAVGTPLAIYSAVYWDHSVVTALAAGAVALAIGAVDSRPSPFRLALAGALLGVGLWFRSEMYVFATTFLVAWIIWGDDRIRGAVAALVGLGIPGGAVWILNTHLVGSPLGWKAEGLAVGRFHSVLDALSGHRVALWLVDKLGNAYYQLLSPEYYAFTPRSITVGLTVSLLLMAGGAVLRRGVHTRSERAILAGAVIAAGTTFALIAARPDVSGLLPSLPFLILVMMPGSLSRGERFLWTLVLLYVLVVIITGTHGGMQWGPRYLLPIVPICVWLTAGSVARVWRGIPTTRPALAVSAGILIFASLALQGIGIDEVRQSVSANAAVNDALLSAPAKIVGTPLEWMTLGAGHVYFEKTLMLVRSPGDLRALVHTLAAKRVTRWTYVPFWGPLFRPEEITHWSATEEWKFRVTDDRTVRGIRFVTYDGTPSPHG